MERRKPSMRVNLRGLCSGRHLRNHSLQMPEVGFQGTIKAFV